MNKYRVADTVLTILVVVIAIAAVAAAVVFTVHWVASHEEPENRTYENVRIYEQELVAMSETINSDRTIAVYFNALQPFSGVDIVSIRTTGPLFPARRSIPLHIQITRIYLNSRSDSERSLQASIL